MIELIFCNIIIIIFIYYRKVEKVKRKKRIDDHKNFFILTNNYMGSGLGNKIFNLLEGMMIAYQSGRCLERIVSYYLVNMFNYFTGYYDYYSDNFCGLSDKIIVKEMIKIHRFGCNHICTDKLLNSSSVSIFYTCTYFQKCSKSEYRKYYRKFIEKFGIIRKHQNIFSSLKFLNNRIFKMTKRGKRLLETEIERIGNSYSGLHLRTWGYFKDFADRNQRTIINWDGLKKALSTYIANINTSVVFFSSDSIKLKLIVKEFLGDRINLVFDNSTTKHSKDFRKGLEESTFLELELLSHAKYSLFTTASTFSLLAYMKNNNCKIHVTCNFTGMIKRYLSKWDVTLDAEG